MSVEERLKAFFEEYAKEVDESIETVKEYIVEDWGTDGLRGYGMFVNEFTDALHIEKIDDMDIYGSDLEASRQAEKDGIKIIHDIDIPEDMSLAWYKDTFVDTEENRQILLKEIESYWN